MKQWLIVLLVVSVAPLMPGCFEDKCKNPRMIDEKEHKTGRMVHGPAIQCNVVLLCPGMAGRPDQRIPVEGQVDPVLVERGGDDTDRCKQAAITRELVFPGCKVDASPQKICLDANGAAGGPGPAPTGDVIVTVGGGVGSGDFPFNEEGAGAADSFGAESAEP